MTGRQRAPIAVFCYNRPDHLKLTLESLGRCEGYDEHSVFIFCDAPQSSDAEPGVDRTRRVARDWVSARGGTLRLRESNLHFRNITEGISEICAEQGRAIIVEDDLVVSPDFLRYLDAGLERYAADQSVYLISAFMYFGAQPPRPQTFFLPYAFIWGWATWERAWSRYREEPEGWNELLMDEERLRRFNINGGIPYGDMLKDVMTGRLATWDIQWTYTVFNEQALGLSPWRSLVWNTGVGGGEHGASLGSSLNHRSKRIHGSDSIGEFRRPRLDSPIELPDRVEVDDLALERLGATLCGPRPRSSWATRLRRKFQR